MANLIQPPITTPVPILNGVLSFLSSQPWMQFFQGIYNALNRQAYPVTIGPFTNIPSGQYGSAFVTLPAGVMSAQDFLLISPVAIPQGTLIQVQASGTPNEFIVFFHNYSGSMKSLSATQVSVLVIPNTLIAGS